MTADRHDPRHFSSVAIELGFVTDEQVAEAEQLREELRANGVYAHLSDLLIDAGAISVQQCAEVELQQEMMLVLSGVAVAEPQRAPVNWIVAATIPVLAITTVWGVLACAVAIALGAVIARALPVRWLAVGWAASTFVPAIPLAAAAATGTVGRTWRHQLGAAVAIAASSGLLLTKLTLTPGVMFLLAGLVLAGVSLRK